MESQLEELEVYTLVPDSPMNWTKSSTAKSNRPVENNSAVQRLVDRKHKGSHPDRIFAPPLDQVTYSVLRGRDPEDMARTHLKETKALVAGDWARFKNIPSAVELNHRNQLQNGAFVDHETQRGPFKTSPVENTIKLGEQREIDVAFFFENCPEQLREAYRKVCWLSITIQLFLPMAIQSEQGIDEWDLYATYFHLCKYVRSG